MKTSFTRAGDISSHSLSCCLAIVLSGFLTSTVALAQSQPPSEQPTSEQPAPEQTPPEQEAEQSLEEVVIRGLNLRGSDVASTATRMPMAIIDIPQTVKIISQDVIAFAGLKTVDDLSKVDASSGATGRNRWGSADLSFRGFDLDFLNGIRMDGFRLLPVVIPDLENVESLEIVKGPVSSQYGQASLGGTINIISKKPEREAQQQIRLQAGQWDSYRADIDSTGPITEDGRLRYRALLGYEDSESFIDYFGRNSKSFTPSIAYDINQNASLLVSGQFQDASMAASNGGPLTAEGELPDVPRSFYWGQSWNSRDTKLRMGQATYTQTFAEGWKWRTAVQYNSSNFDLLYGQPLIFAPMQPDGSTLYQSLEAHSEQSLKGAETTLYGPFKAFGREHTLFLAVDGYDRKIDYLQFSEFYDFLPVFNIFNPNYNLPTPDTSGTPGAFNQHQRVYGGTAQVLLHFTERLSTLLGARYDNAKFDINGVDTGEGDSKTVVQAGLTYALAPDVNLYANYGQTFLPQQGVTFPDLENVGSQEGEQVEVGVKSNLLNNKLFFSFALFDMNRSHIQQDDPLNPGFSILLGKQRSRGIELDASGKIMAVDVYGSFSWIDSEFTEGAFKGLHPATTPKFAASLYTNYQLPGRLSPVGVGIGVVHKQGIQLGGFGPFAFSPTQQEVSPFNEYTLVDLRLTYKATKHLFIAAAMSNVLDEDYYLDYQGWGSFTQAGEPRRVRAEMRYTF